MRLISIARSEPGMFLAKPIYTQSGTILLNTDVELTGSIIKRLEKLGIDKIYIKDPLTEDVIVEDPISDETRRQAMTAINETLLEVARGDHKWKGALGQGRVKQIRDSFEAILAELRENKNTMNLLSDAYVCDQYIFSHSLNVCLYAVTMALHMGYKEKELMELGFGSLLHDIGKMMIPQEILHKPGTLTQNEFQEMQRHTEYGYDILRKSDGVPLLSAHCALQHHERGDGSGYPRGLKETEIHKFAKVLMIADVFDALTSRRSYRKAMLPHEALEVLYVGSGRHFDTSMVEVFRNVVAIYPAGITVTLNTGEKGVVVDYNRHSPSRPIVRLIEKPNGEPVKEFVEIDLSKQHTIMIKECDLIL